MSRRVLVAEWVTAGGLADDPVLEAELMPMGVAMRDALVTELADAPTLRLDWRVCVAESAAAPWSGAEAGDIALWSAAPHANLIQALCEAACGFDALWVVAPESGGLLASCASAIGRPRWVGCSADAVTTFSSKARTRRALRRAGVASPDHPVLWAQATHWVVKPDDGAGAVDVFRHHDLGAAQAMHRARKAAGLPSTCEPWVDGPAMSLSILCQGGQAELLSVNHQHIECDAQGQVHYLGVEPSLLDATADAERWWRALNLAQALAASDPGLQGFVGVDVVWHADLGPVAIEVNPRITCAYVGLGERLGRWIAAEALLAHASAQHNRAQ